MHQNHRRGLCHPGKISFERELPLYSGVLCIPLGPKHAGPIAHDKGRNDHGDIQGPKLVSTTLTQLEEKDLVTRLVQHATNDAPSIYIKVWFE